MLLDGLFMDDPVGWLTAGATGAPTRAGPLVNEFEALTLPAVFRAVDTLTSHMAMLPLPVCRKIDENRRERLPDHPVHHTLNVAHNPETTAFQGRKTLALHTFLWGMGLQERVKADGGGNMELWPLLPHLSRLRRNDSGALVVEVLHPSGLLDRVLPDEDVVRVSGLSYDGIQGLGLVRQLARENLGEALAITQYVQSFFGNGTTVGTVITYPQSNLDQEFKQEVLDQFTGKHQGAHQGFKAIVMDGDAKITKVGSDNKAAQTLELKTYSVQDVARWLNISPPFLMELSRATFTNITELGAWHVKYTLGPLFVAYEQAYTARLFTPIELADGLCVKFMPDALLRGDPKTRAEGHRIAIASGWKTINEVRALEDLPPIGPEGDVHLVPVNMQPLEQAVKEPEPVPEALAPQDVPQPGGANAPQDEKQNVEAIKLAMMPVFVDAATRVLRKEQAAVGRAMDKHDWPPKDKDAGDKWDAWLHGFYARHRTHVHEAMLPAANAMANCLGADVAWNSDGLFIDYVAHHVGESLATLEHLDAWTTERPPMVAAALTDAIADEVARQEVHNESTT